MNVGINWSGQRELPCINQLFLTRDIDFVELLIDNFLTTDVDSIKAFLAGRPCAFHIMNSQFLHKDERELLAMAKIINKLIHSLRPIYISDHIGKFYHRGQALPQMLEVDYGLQTHSTIKKVKAWSSLLDGKLLLENYPSIFPQDMSQIDFFKRILEETDCGLLFDISNAFIAEVNIKQSRTSWFDLIKHCQHFHIAGFENAPDNQFLVDTHSQCIEEPVLSFLQEVNNAASIATISVERDENFDVSDWALDIDNVRNRVSNGRDTR